LWWKASIWWQKDLLGLFADFNFEEAAHRGSTPFDCGCRPEPMNVVERRLGTILDFSPTIGGKFE
jgi:hypothetical protein